MTIESSMSRAFCSADIMTSILEFINDEKPVIFNLMSSCKLMGCVSSQVLKALDFQRLTLAGTLKYLTDSGLRVRIHARLANEHGDLIGAISCPELLSLPQLHLLKNFKQIIMESHSPSADALWCTQLARNVIDLHWVPRPASLETSFSFPRNFPNLRVLSVENASLALESLNVLQSSPLTWLTLTNCNLTGNVNSPMRLPRLRALHIRWSPIYPQQNLDIFARHENVESLFLSDCRLESLAGIAEKFPNVEILNLQGNDQINCLRPLQPLLSGSLKKLNLHDTEIKTIVPLRGFQLTSLDLSGCTRLDLDLSVLLGMLPSLQCLRIPVVPIFVPGQLLKLLRNRELAWPDEDNFIPDSRC